MGDVRVSMSASTSATCSTWCRNDKHNRRVVQVIVRSSTGTRVIQSRHTALISRLGFKYDSVYGGSAQFLTQTLPRATQKETETSSELHSQSPLSERQVARSRDEDSASPHHVETPAEIPLSSPARLLSDTLISINVIVFLLQVMFPEVTLTGVKMNSMIDQGEWYRLLSAAFLHGSPTHLMLNMLSLHSLGTVCEWTCGRGRFLTIYLFSAICGNIASYYGAPDAPSLGASGAIFGIAGALIVYFARNKVLYRNSSTSMAIRLGITVALNFGLGMLLPNIDEYGHLGGLLGGATMAVLLGPSYDLCYLKGREGVWLIDETIIPFFSDVPRRVYHDDTVH
jgi:membrane associated rhomboid family serine protease